MNWNQPTEYQDPPEGTYPARCIRLIDMGTQETEYKGEKKRHRKVAITWELPTELIEEGERKGEPFSITQWYTQSLGEQAALRALLEGWRGTKFTADSLKSFNPRNLIGAPCLLILTKGENGRVRVTGAGKLPKGLVCPAQVNKSVYLSLAEDEFDQSVFDELSDRVRERIASSPEYQHLRGPKIRNQRPAAEPQHEVAHDAPAAPVEEDDVPF